ncbi:MAG: plasmid partitioning protein RepB [Cohaesibacteraceae bacterium]|nr:plasmid partitioning protein RepB [Cohaesibacteraceae bacterium]
MSKKKLSNAAMFGSVLSDMVSKGNEAIEAATPKPGKARVSSGVIAAARDTALADLRDERDRLKQELASASDVISIDVTQIVPSPFPDRLVDEDAREAFELLKTSIKAEGQQVPILVRPHGSGRYQICYGHRRLRAVTELGHGTVNALVRELDDHQLISAQGLENSARQDLTFIEKALFAEQIRKLSQTPKEAVERIKLVLSCTDADASAFKMVLTRIPAELIRLIGSSPKIGKPRWKKLADIFASQKHADTIASLVRAAEFQSIASSNDRFEAALKAGIPAVIKQQSPQQIVIGNSRVDVVHKANLVTLSTDNTDFGSWLGTRVEILYEQYCRDNSSDT